MTNEGDFGKVQEDWALPSAAIGGTPSGEEQWDGTVHPHISEVADEYDHWRGSCHRPECISLLDPDILATDI